MGRNRVLSFMSQFSASARDSLNSSPSPANEPNGKPDLSSDRHPTAPAYDSPPPRYTHENELETTPPASPARNSHDNSPVADTPITVTKRTGTRSRSNSRPLSIVQSYQPPLMAINEDTIPELQPIFTFLNSHANKLYQEGYFLKLDDQNAQGRPNPDRTWTECFAQLVGTVLSLWDASELDAAGEDGEVLPKFVNLTDASIKMIESLPTRSQEEQPLQNILSISTAGRNRYLLHFNSRHSLLQWTAGIRLAMFEHSTLQEAYTGALIAGKGKTLNNIGLIMERSRTPMQEWVRVRFGAGVPWRRCWCVITPPDDKEYQKLHKELKKKSPYDRSHPPVLKGDVKFFDHRVEGRKLKKVKPIATITDSYSAYAIYPQAKSLIEASTLVKIEGNITIHSDPPSSTEGFVFVMPEVHPAVTGFETMLRYLFPTWDTFGLYGRPGRLAASTLDQRSLMFAMPKHKRYGYLEILDVTGLILSDTSSSWTERDWRKRLKELTSQKLTSIDSGAESTTGRARSNSTKRLSFGPSAGGVAKARLGLADSESPAGRSSRSMSLNQRPAPRTDSAPPLHDSHHTPSAMATVMRASHSRNVSDPSIGEGASPPRYDSSAGDSVASGRGPNVTRAFVNDLASTPERVSSDDEPAPSVKDLEEGMRTLETPEPVSQPPAFTHGPGHKPQQRPYHSPELRRANSRMSVDTLAQLEQAGGVHGVGEQQGWTTDRTSDEQSSSSAAASFDQRGPLSVRGNAYDAGMIANPGTGEGLRKNPNALPVPTHGAQRSKSPLYQAMAAPSPGAGPAPIGNPTIRGQAQFVLPNRGPQTYEQPPNVRGGPEQNQAHGGSSDRPFTPGGNGPMSKPLSYSPSIQRKPLPTRTDSLSSNGSFSFAHGIDPGVLAQVHSQPSSGRGSPQPHYRADTMKSTASSIYPDSTASPDYASSRASTETARSVKGPDRSDKPRAGVLRTVGDEALRDESLRLESYRSEFDIPDVDFGPAFNYKANPAKDKAPASGAPDRSLSPPAPPSKSVVLPPPPRKSPGPTQDSDDGAKRRSVVWHPSGAAVSSGTSPVKGISAEQFVQQRAAATPFYAHQRQASNLSLGGLRAGTPTPPLVRRQSRDYLGAHSRTASTDQLASMRNTPPLERRQSRDYLGSHSRSKSVDPLAHYRSTPPLEKRQSQDYLGSHSRSNSVDPLARYRSTPPLEKRQSQDYLGSHSRSNSVDPLAGFRSTPPLERRQSRDYLGAHSRTNSSDLLQRPGSRGAGYMLDPMQRPSSRGAGSMLDPIQRPGSRGAGAVLGGQARDTSLSAREQEHIARMTGTPLINMATNKPAPQQGGNGLVGAIQAREREKQQMKQGYGGQSVQYAINQRQYQHQQQQQQQAYQAYQPSLPSQGMPPPSGMYSTLGRQSPGLPQMQSQQGYGFPQSYQVNGGVQAYPQSGWPVQQGNYAPQQGRYVPQQGIYTPQQGHYAPQQGGYNPGYLPPQGQFTPQFATQGQSPRSGQQPQGYGFPNSAHQGQAF